MTGHLLGAAGALEFIVAALATKEGAIPPTINLENQDPECDLNVTGNKAVYREVDVALSNVFGFGGHNVPLAVRRYKD
jgi:3-oxoacyl-[acyl-carrier-protein] synthase II